MKKTEWTYDENIGYHWYIMYRGYMIRRRSSGGTCYIVGALQVRTLEVAKKCIDVAIRRQKENQELQLLSA